MLGLRRLNLIDAAHRYMKILLTGVNGQVGRALQKSLAAHTVIAVDRAKLDLSQPDQIQQCVRSIQPQLIIHPAAYTAVDQAETEPALAHAVNAIAPQCLAEEAARIGAGMVHFSTDYVYDGQKEGAYLESDAVHPLSQYGRTKLAGEQAVQAVGLPHLILRTSWVYSADGSNFLKTMLRLFATREVLNVVDDQYGAPTSSDTIATAVAQLVMRWHQQDADQSGIYHLVNQGATSWYGFANEIKQQYLQHRSSRQWPDLRLQQLNPIPSDAYPTPAKRPKNSTLSTEKLVQQFGIELIPWHQALEALFYEQSLDAHIVRA